MPVQNADPFAPRTWRLGHGRSIELGPDAVLMAILNVTPDSFSDGGRLQGVDHAVETALRLEEQGAQIIDVGGESTRPGAQPISAGEEQARVLPVIEALKARTDALISIDTYRAETARLAVAAGAHIINDVTGLTGDPAMADVAALTGAGLCLMHTGRGRQPLADVVADEIAFLAHALAAAAAAGVAEEAIVLDPGFGFGLALDTQDNLDIAARFAELHRLGRPFLVGTSRKRFIGAVTGRATAERDVGTAAMSVVLRLAGAAVFRVHNVEVNRDALVIADAVLSRGRAQAQAQAKAQATVTAQTGLDPDRTSR